MRLSRTLSIYIGKQFLFWFATVAFGLFTVIIFFEALELMRRVFKNDSSEAGAMILTMAMLKAPTLLEKVIPFAALLGAALCFWRLNRHHETIVTRGAGVSIWQFLVPPILLALVIGTISVTVFNPLSSALLLKYEALESKHIRGGSRLAAVANKGLWFRQPVDSGVYVLHADSISMRDYRLHDVIVFQMEEHDSFTARIDAPSAVLEDGVWRFEGRVAVTRRNQVPTWVENLTLPTDLTPNNINESFAPPETISFWSLSDFISVLENAGFSGVRHRLHLHSLLALPLTLAAAIFLAATFSLRPERQQSGAFLITLGIGIGFLIYFITDIVLALGAASKIPVIMAAWTPVVASTLVGLALLLHLEDG